MEVQCQRTKILSCFILLLSTFYTFSIFVKAIEGEYGSHFHVKSIYRPGGWRWGGGGGGRPCLVSKGNLLDFYCSYYCKILKMIFHLRPCLYNMPLYFL